MKRIVTFFALLQLAFFAGPVLAQDGGYTYQSARVVATESWVEEWDAASGRWVQVEADVNGGTAILASVSEAHSATRYAKPAMLPIRDTMLAQYGPFVVISATSATMMGPTDTATPAQFDAMLRDFPQVATLQMVEAPGTSNDIANLEVGRRIREAGIATHVPSGGSVRSGAVELFLAGAIRTMEDGAQFAVHSWLDNHGREADDLAADHPAHRLYIDYYVEMGMSEERARDFYAMTNSVPHSSALWLGSADMQRWLPRDRTPAFRLAKVEAEVSVESGAISLEAALGMIDLDWEQSVEPVILPSLDVPSLDYVDLTTISLAQLDPANIA